MFPGVMPSPFWAPPKAGILVLMCSTVFVLQLIYTRTNTLGNVGRCEMERKRVAEHWPSIMHTNCSFACFSECTNLSPMSPQNQRSSADGVPWFTTTLGTLVL